MNTRVICKKCKAENVLGSMFCRTCGEKLDVSEKSIRTSKYSERKSGGLMRIVRLIVLLALISLLGLMLWQVEPQGTQGEPDHALVFQNRLLNLERAWQQGVHLEEEVSEPQVNAYLAQAVEQTNQRQETGGLQLVLRTINLAFVDGAFVLTTLSDLGPLRISYEVTGSVVPANGELRFDVEQVRLGHLVLPAILADQAAARIAHVFSSMKREQEILSHAAEISLGIDRIRIKL